MTALTFEQAVFGAVETLLAPVGFLFSMQYRIFWGYLLLSAIIGFFVIKKNNKSNRQAFSIMASRKFWLHPSVLLDIKIIFLNNALWLICLAPYFSSQLSLAVATRRLLKDQFGSGDFLNLSTLSLSIIYTLTVFIIDDFSRFFIHRAYHKHPLLWRFHAVHHSATRLSPFTLYRVHIIENIINATRSILVHGLLGGIFMYLFVGKITALEVFGASIFSLAFNLAGANLRHSHIWFSFVPLERFFISPAQHQIHHSANPKHLDKNFGVMLPYCDQLFGTWLNSKEQTVKSIGLQTPIEQSLKAHIFGIK